MTLREAVVLLALPPLDLPLLGLAGLLLARRHRAGLWLAAAALLLLLLLAWPLTAALLLAGLEQPDAPAGAAQPGAIVILGGTVERVLDPAGQQVTELGALTRERLRRGLDLARSSGLPILVSGGRLTSDEPPIAELMAARLAELGTPARWRETGSRDTWENAADSAAMLRPLGIGRVYVVTQPWHMRRARLAFAAAGLAAVAASTPRDLPPRWRMAGLPPSVRSWQRSFYALHEWLGLAWYTLRRATTK